MPTPEEEAKIKTDKEAADKKVVDDAKTAADKKLADEAAAGDENITIKKKDWEKTNSDLENYKTGLLNKKAADRSTLNQNMGDSNQNNSGALDEKKVIEIATRASKANTHKTNEKTAIKNVYIKHPEYLEDKNWQELLPHLPGNINYDDPAAIEDAFEGAVLLHKRSTGKLDEYMAEQAVTARREAEMNAQVNMGFGAGGNGQKLNQGNQSGKPAESTVQMGKYFGHDAEKIEKSLKEIEKNPEGGFSIDVTKKKK